MADERKRFILPADAVSSALTEIAQGLWSPNELDRNMETANVVDGLFAIARALHQVAKALETIKPLTRNPSGPTTGFGGRDDG